MPLGSETLGRSARRVGRWLALSRDLDAEVDSRRQSG